MMSGVSTTFSKPLGSELETVNLSSLITDIDTTHVSYVNAFKSGNVVYICTKLLSGITYESTIFKLPTVLQPVFNAVTPIFKGSDGKINNSGALWIEASSKSNVKYYGDTLDAMSYATFVYLTA